VYDEIANAVHASSATATSAVEADAEQTVQIFAQLDPKQGRRSMKNEWGAIVERATKRLADGTYRVTVTDPWGGRGYDFRCLDDAVNEHGGLLLIVTSIPQEREWIQWKGRTARQDRKGQFSVVLCQADPPFASGQMPGVVADALDQPDSLIRTLLDEADTANLKKIRDNRKGVDTGRYLAELCDKYYRKYRRDTREWPSVQWKDKDRILRDELLQKASNLSVKDIEAGARKLGLQMSFGGPIGSEPEDA